MSKSHFILERIDTIMYFYERWKIQNNDYNAKLDMQSFEKKNIQICNLMDPNINYHWKSISDLVAWNCMWKL